MGASEAEIGQIWFALLALWKIITGIFLLVAVALSSWWRSL